MTAEQLWAEFCEVKGIDKSTRHEAWAFGGEGDVPDELADLVLAGKKFGTASAYDLYVFEDALEELPKVGDYSVVLKQNDEAVCVIRDYDVYIRPFGEVSPFHAYSEGEGDRSLRYWREVHEDFFTPDLEECGVSFSEETLVVCEKFCVEYAPGTEEEEILLAEPSETYAEEIMAYRKEMLEAGSSFDGCFSLKRQENPQEFIDRCLWWSNPKTVAEEIGCKGTVFLAIRKVDGKMVGCVQAHHEPNERMNRLTGHVGYSVRPSERRKGYATKLLAKAKDYLATFGFEEIYVSCVPDNEGSKKTILANGGVYTDTKYLEPEGVYLDRYRIRLE